MQDLIDSRLNFGRRWVLLDVLDIRFGSVPDDIYEEIVSCHDKSRLDLLIQQANECGSLNEFRTRLTTPPAN